MNKLVKKICIKCGNIGHTLRICENSVTSFGLIVYTCDSDIDINGKIYPQDNVYSCSLSCKTNDQKKIYTIYRTLFEKIEKNISFVLVERRDTISFINLIQGIYPDIKDFLNVPKIVLNLIKELTCEERYKLQNCDFDYLWAIAGSARKIKSECLVKFEFLYSNLTFLFSIVNCSYLDANYIIPKGRLKIHETPQECAIREFCEETGFSPDCIIIDPRFNNVNLQDSFLGSDYKSYKNVYYVAKLLPKSKIIVPLHNIKEQVKEVRNVGLFHINSICDIIRPSDKKILSLLHQVSTLIPFAFSVPSESDAKNMK